MRVRHSCQNQNITYQYLTPGDIYLYYDSNDRIWIFPGEVTGINDKEGNFEVRYSEY